MKKELIKDKNKILALILRSGDFPPGLIFHTKEKDFLQVGTWNYEKGKKTVPHAHKTAKRTVNRTQEFIYVKKGKMRADIYNDKGKFLKKIALEAGDIVIIFGGGHSYEVLEDNTQVLEIKNGPYPGLEKDKKVIHENKKN